MAATAAEAIRTGAAAGIPLQISHISVVARLSDDGVWALEQALAQVEQARARGLDVGFDMHTQTYPSPAKTTTNVYQPGGPSATPTPRRSK